MNNKKHIEKLIGETMDSLDGAGRATPKPFLFTRINARLNKKEESVWETAARFITRPAVIIAGLCMIISINALVIVYNNTTGSTSTTVADQLSATADEFSTTVATLDDIENTEPQ